MIDTGTSHTSPNAAGQRVIAARTDALKTLVSTALLFRTELALRQAVAGDGMGGLIVPDEPRRIYVQLGAAGGDVAEAEVDQFDPEIGDDVLLMRKQILGLGGWIVLGNKRADSDPCANGGAL